MKAAMAVFLILGSAAIIISAVDLSRSDSVTITGSAIPVTGGSNIDARGMEARIAELRQGAESYNSSAKDEDGEFISSGNVKALSPGSRLERFVSIYLPSNNSSDLNSSLLNFAAANSTALNSTPLNSSAGNLSASEESSLASTNASSFEIGNLSRSIKASSQRQGASSQASAKGFYNSTSSRQGMGASLIQSSMSLKGDFDVERSSSFQDRGF
ncbi:MAG: hypothetical protein ACP5PV_11580 [Methanothrix sp.]